VIPSKKKKLKNKHISKTNFRACKKTVLFNEFFSGAKEPLTAYNIIYDLRDHCFRGATQVYRVLEKLLEIGIVHRIESMNAFIAC
jgi:Fur family zinc uptake transcriptional regulator